MGLHQRDLSDTGSWQGAKPWLRHTLDRERNLIWHLSGDRCAFGSLSICFFAVMMLLQFIVVLFFFPETKRVSLEELQHMLKIE